MFGDSSNNTSGPSSISLTSISDQRGLDIAVAYVRYERESQTKVLSQYKTTRNRVVDISNVRDAIGDKIELQRCRGFHEKAREILRLQ